MDNQSELGPLVLEVECRVFHYELNDGSWRNCVAREVDGVVFHSIPEKDESRSMLHDESQLLFDLVELHIAPQQ